jgi:hypothetical protein
LEKIWRILGFLKYLEYLGKIWKIWICCKSWIVCGIC